MSNYFRSNRQSTFLASVCLSLTLLVGCASDEDYGRGSEQEVFERAQRYLDSYSWELAIDTLQALEENFPFGTYAEQAQLELIYAYYKAGEFEAALASADRFIRLHPQHRNVDYAFYMRGIASFYNDSVFSSFFPVDTTMRDPGTAKESFNHFAELLNEYPQSPYALDAEKRMIYLRNTLARAEINVANYYFKRGAYLAAANRGRWVVENMQGTPAVPDALAVMAQAYHLIDMQPLSEDAIKVLKYNYPHYPALEDGEFDYQYGSDQDRSWVSYVTFGVFDKRPSIKFDTRKVYDPFYDEDSAGDILEPPAG
ncbi:outer membrane protein assembly factor BamD [Agaribacterium haliotis]|uniref:outer membrane protein assembly factor BamD n=1 Tax=Agaribacterium haliotis TaxID=2013869 RepID=UPI000BB537D1|nr:outer membrane protein assembly factor BamD [Agaribacterium haliotis]